MALAPPHHDCVSRLHDNLNACSNVAAELLVLFINFQNDLSARLTNPCTYPCTGANLGQERVGLGIPPGYRCVQLTVCGKAKEVKVPVRAT